VSTLIVEGVISFIIIAALFYVAPGVLGLIKISAPRVYGNAADSLAASGYYDPALNATGASISTSVSGGLSLSSLAIIMLGVGLMIGGFMFIRGRKQ
jgi:hypothetical protein